jgi:hypothetical protein
MRTYRRRNVQGTRGFAVGFEGPDVVLDRGEEGRVGPIEAASGALEPDRAPAAAGLTVDRDITGVLTAAGGMARRLLQVGLSGDMLVYDRGGLAPVT